MKGIDYFIECKRDYKFPNTISEIIHRDRLPLPLTLKRM